MKRKNNLIMHLEDIKIGLIGLGYVGLPLALLFRKKLKVIGYDKNKNRIKDLKKGVDNNQEFSKGDLKENNRNGFSHALTRETSQMLDDVKQEHPKSLTT